MLTDAIEIVHTGADCLCCFTSSLDDGIGLVHVSWLAENIPQGSLFPSGSLGLALNKNISFDLIPDGVTGSEFFVPV